MEPPFAHHLRTMVKSPIKEIDDGQYSADHYKFISWKPTTLKHAIESSGPILLIKHLGVMGFHHAAAAATGKHRCGMSAMRRAFK
jgi:hypothetical protein